MLFKCEVIAILRADTVFLTIARSNYSCLSDFSKGFDAILALRGSLYLQANCQQRRWIYKLPLDLLTLSDSTSLLVP